MSGINGDTQLEYWIDRYQNLIFSICFQLTKDYFDAQDLTQETFLSAYKNMSGFDGRNERAWLCKIASRKCLDYQFLIICSPAESSPEQDLMEKALRQELYDCCMKLKEPYRQTALDYFYHEMDAGEIAARTGKNLKTVQTGP